MAFPTRPLSLMVMLVIAFCFHSAAIARKLDVEEEYSISTERYAGLVEELGFHETEEISERDEVIGFLELEEITENLSKIGFPNSGENTEELSAELGFSNLGEDTQDIFAEQSSAELMFSDFEENLEKYSAEVGLGFHDEGSFISSVLDQNGLPIGLLPSSVESYSLSGDGGFRVSLDLACYAKFDYEVYYAQTITGKLSYGAVSDLSGIQAKEAFFWVPVTSVRVDIPSSGYIYFDAGPISKKLPISQFEEIPDCKHKAMDSSALA